jgi:hypothetical protein
VGFIRVQQGVVMLGILWVKIKSVFSGIFLPQKDKLLIINRGCFGGLLESYMVFDGVLVENFD